MMVSLLDTDIPVVSTYPTPAVVLQMRRSSGNLYLSLSRHSQKSGTILCRGDLAFLRKSTPNRTLILSFISKRCTALPPCSLAAHDDIMHCHAGPCDAIASMLLGLTSYILPILLRTICRFFFTRNERPRPMIQIRSIS